MWMMTRAIWMIWAVQVLIVMKYQEFAILLFRQNSNFYFQLKWKTCLIFYLYILLSASSWFKLVAAADPTEKNNSNRYRTWPFKTDPVQHWHPILERFLFSIVGLKCLEMMPTWRYQPWDLVKHHSALTQEWLLQHANNWNTLV